MGTACCGNKEVTDKDTNLSRKNRTKKKGKKVEHVQVTEARNLMANVNADMEMATAKVEQEAAERTKAFALSQ